MNYLQQEEAYAGQYCQEEHPVFCDVREAAARGKGIAMCGRQPPGEKGLRCAGGSRPGKREDA